MSELDTLKSDPEQARRHGERNLRAVIDSIIKVGFNDPGVIDENDTVLAGNLRLEAAKQAGIKKARIIETDGTEAIFIRRRGLTQEQKRFLAIASNRAAELAEGWVVSALEEAVKQGIDLSWLWTENDLAKLIREAAGVDTEEQISAAADGDEMAATGIRQVKLYYSGEEYLEFRKLVDRIGATGPGGGTLSEIVLWAIEEEAARNEDAAAGGVS